MTSQKAVVKFIHSDIKLNVFFIIICNGMVCYLSLTTFKINYFALVNRDVLSLYRNFYQTRFAEIKLIYDFFYVVK